MTSKINSIVQDLKSLTLLEAAELVKEIEEVFGVDASVSNAGTLLLDQSESSGSVSNKEQEQTEFNVLLETVPAAKKNCCFKGG